jgi:hypothetical protein
VKASVPFRHVFVESVPEEMEQAVVYVSIRFRSAIHLCACGCGNQVVTPLSPTDWRLTFDGVSVSLDPSVGNWSLPCRSHYFIRRNKAVWAGEMSDERIASGREHDRRLKDRYYSGAQNTKVVPTPQPETPSESKPGMLGRAFEFLFGKSDRK